MKNNKVINISDYKKQDDWHKFVKEIEAKWTIDFDKKVKENAHTIPEKISAFIWEHTGKTGYLYIEDGVKFVFYAIYSLLLTVLFGVFLVFCLIGLEKLYILLH